MGIDTRVYDAKTSEVLASTVTRGTATATGADIKMSNAKMDASAGGFMTPLGQASRQALAGAVQFIVTVPVILSVAKISGGGPSPLRDSG